MSDEALRGKCITFFTFIQNQLAIIAALIIAPRYE
jgi:hypothetical protein